MIYLAINTSSQEQFLDITEQVARALLTTAVSDGICVLFVPHTTCGITLNESCDPSVARDLEMALRNIEPPGLRYAHAEGNSAAHLKAMLVGSSVSIPVVNHRLCLGTWQGVFLTEFDGPRRRKVMMKLLPS